MGRGEKFRKLFVPQLLLFSETALKISPERGKKKKRKKTHTQILCHAENSKKK